MNNSLRSSIDREQLFGLNTLLLWFVAFAWLTLIIALSTYIGLMFLVVGLLPVLLLYKNIPIFVIFTLLGGVFFQNCIISIFSPDIKEPFILTALQGYNFLILSVIALLTLVEYKKFKGSNPPLDKVYYSVFGVLCVAGLYLLYGALLNGATDALIYFRNFTNGLLFLLCGLYAIQYVKLEHVFKILSFLAILVLSYGYFELFFTKSLYEFINLDYFNALKYGNNGWAIHELIGMFRRSFFNTPILRDLGLTSFRLLGPNMHTISFAYILSFVVMLSLSQRHYIRVFLAMVLILTIGGKGAFLVATVAIIATIVRACGVPHSILFVGLSLGLLAFIVISLVIGTQIGDYHVLGFYGGLEGILNNPIGHGFGSGGNLSSSGLRGDELVNWSEYQKIGQTSFGLESTVGVMMYQWGLFGAFLYLALVGIWAKIYWNFDEKMKEFSPEIARKFFPFFAGFGVLIANMIFQEEAMSPAAIGLQLFMFGVFVRFVSTKNNV